jgi:Flp pilus assembly protein TadG
MLRQPTARRRQLGAIHILYLGTLPLMIGAMGMMIDLSRVQARKAELQVAVDAAVLAAAKSLQTVPNNYAAATTAASQAINFYQFKIDNTYLIALPAATVTFGATKDGPDWRSAAAAVGSGFKFAKVDSLAAPAEAYGKVDTLLVHFLSAFDSSPVTPTTLNVVAVAVAGPLGVNVGLHQ